MMPFVQIITGFLGSLGFAILYNIRGKKLVAAALGGFMSWSLFLLLGLFMNSEPIRYLIVSMSISIYAEFLARVLKTPTTTFIITALIPLIPGASLYYTMSSAFGGNFEVFLGNAVSTLSLALALAVGVAIIAAGARLVIRFKLSIQQHNGDMSPR